MQLKETAFAAAALALVATSTGAPTIARVPASEHLLIQKMRAVFRRATQFLATSLGPPDFPRTSFLRLVTGPEFTPRYRSSRMNCDRARRARQVVLP